MVIKQKAALINLIYAMIYILAICEIRYRLALQATWGTAVKVFALLIVFLCVIYLLMNNLKRLYSAFVGCFVIYVFWISLINDLLIMPGIIIDAVLWPLVLIVFYEYHSRNNVPDMIKYISVVGLVLVYLVSLPNLREHLLSYGRYGAVIGPVYFTFAFLPMIYLTCSKKTSVIYSVITIVIMILSTKRVGIAVSVIGFIVYLFFDAYNHGNVKKGKRIFLLTVAITLGAGILYLILRRYYSVIIDRFSQAIINSDTSGRTSIWKYVMEHFWNNSFIKRLFGNGFHAVSYRLNYNNRGLNAHNSWMEMLYDYGYVGVAFVIIIFKRLFSTFFQMIKDRDNNLPALSFTIPAFLLMSFFAYFFEQSLIILPLCAFWGICMEKKNTGNGNKKFVIR